MRNKILLLLLGSCCAVAIILYATVWAPKTQAETGGEESALSGVIINEAMSSNSGAVPDNYGDFPDWIELYNSGSEPVELSGWGLSDNPAKGARFVFSRYELLPDSYVVVYCSGTARDELHAAFALKAGKDTVQLTDASGQIQDTLPLVAVEQNHSIARDVENPDEWAEAALPTPGFKNNAEGRAQYESTMKAESTGVSLWEIQPSNVTTIKDSSGVYSDWIELFNTTNQTMDISNFCLSDDPASPAKWRFPEGTKLEPNSYALIFCDGGANVLDSSGALHANFRLSSYQETVVFADSAGRIIEEVPYSEIPADASYARESASGEWKISSTPTPGFSNDPDGFQRYLELNDSGEKPVYISEFMMTNDAYLPEKVGKTNVYGDWIELFNATGADIDLTGWGLTDNAKNPAKWRFPEGSIIKSGEYKLLIADGGKSTEQYAHVGFSIANSDGETLTLWQPDGTLADKITGTHQYDGVSYGRSTDGKLYFYSTPTPGEVNGEGFLGYSQTPAISLAAGFYSGSQTVEISRPEGSYVYYTTDGSVPTQSSQKYEAPVTISKTTVVRARAYVFGQLPSRVATATYFIDHPHADTLSLVSVSTDPALMFDAQTGIYAMGPNASADAPYKGANFWQEVEIPAHVEIFRPSGSVDLSQDTAFRIFGAYSRGREQKGFAIIARSSYGPSRLMAKLFDDRDYPDYKSIVLRASGQDSTVSKIRDIVATSLVDGTNDGKTNLQTQAYRQAVLYINGEYFGIYNIREKVTKYFLQQHYGVDPENIDLLVGNNSTLHGGSEDYKALLDYLENNKLSAQENYDYVASRVDIDNYIDYLIAEIYIANTDTGNIKWFRERAEGENGKYRWLYYDFCWSLSNYKMDSIEYMTNPKGHGVGKGFSTLLTRSLMRNEGFREKFITRFGELMRTIYATENVLARVEECEAAIAEEKERDSERWPEGGGVANWRANVKLAKTFAAERPAYIEKTLKDYFYNNFNMSTGRFNDLYNG